MLPAPEAGTLLKFVHLYQVHKRGELNDVTGRAE
jgi:hypothetical protein